MPAETRETQIIEPRPAPTPTVERSIASGDPEKAALDKGSLGHRATTKDRDDILTALYAERRELTRAKRLTKSTPFDDARLADVNAYIDHWETSDPQASDRDDVWGRLEALAADVLSVRASIEQNKK